MRPKDFLLVSFLHLLIAGVIAPSLGCAVYNFAEVDWKQAPLPFILLGSLVGGVLLQVFIWFITIPFAFITMLICFGLCCGGVTRRIIWVLGGILIGGGYGLFFANWAHISVNLLVPTGMIIGAITGWALNAIWTKCSVDLSDPERLV